MGGPRPHNQKETLLMPLLKNLLMPLRERFPRRAVIATVSGIALGVFMIAVVPNFIIPLTLENADWHGNIANSGWELGGFGAGVFLHRLLRV